MNDIPETTIAELIDRYEALLFDAYGVLVHSTGARPGAAALIQRLNRLGKPYYVVTNDASKLPATAARRYRAFGLAISAKRILSAGELLKNYFEAHALRGARCVVLGPPDGRQYVVQAGGVVVSPADAFDVLVIADESGFPFLETLDVALTTLYRLLDRGERPHLLVPNPDLVYPSSETEYGFAAGTVAAMFEAALRVRYPRRTDLVFERLGKPSPGLFEEAIRRAGTRNMVMIGDQLETDIRGAAAAGLDSAWLSTGVTAADAGLPGAWRPNWRLRSLNFPRDFGS